MAGSQAKTNSLREVNTVDPEIRKYLQARAKPSTPQDVEQEKQLAGLWVARRKNDAKIVAFAEDYAALEDRLDEESIDAESVVIGVIDDPSVIFVE